MHEQYADLSQACHSDNLHELIKLHCIQLMIIYNKIFVCPGELIILPSNFFIELENPLHLVFAAVPSSQLEIATLPSAEAAEFSPLCSLGTVALRSLPAALVPLRFPPLAALFLLTTLDLLASRLCASLDLQLQEAHPSDFKIN